MTKLFIWTNYAFCFAMLVATSIIANAQGFDGLTRFGGPNGAIPSSPLVQGQDGRFYGTTSSGGANGGGEVFRISTTGRLQFYSFCSQPKCLDGGEPDGLVLNSDGDFYGTAAIGGANGYGTFFKITPNGRLTTIYSFCPQTGCPDGEAPLSLILGYDGNFYGTTSAGGTYGTGTLFKITPAGKLSTLYTFCSLLNCSDGSYPKGNLILAADGNLYGTTYSGGVNEPCGYLNNGCGTIFRMTTHGAITTLYRFCSAGYPACPDGNNPRGGLTQAADDSLYGTTYGIPFQTGGTIFNITTGGLFTTLYTFCSLQNCVDGWGPIGEVVQGMDGNLYGTTLGGSGPSISGTIFEFGGATLTTLYDFCSQTNCVDGFEPEEGVMQGTIGLFYGNTFSGGGRGCGDDGGCGTAFSFGAGLSPFVTFIRAGGAVGQTGGILGQGFTRTTGVSINGTPASFTVVSDTFIQATVPAGATTGYVTVATPTGTLTSNVPFHVIP